MDKIKDKIKSLKRFQAQRSEIIFSVMMENKEIIIDSIVEEQLYEKGINGLGVEIMDYQPYGEKTIEYKKMKNQPYDRVTLRDTGDFHASFDVVKEGNQIRIIATDWKTDHLIRKYGKEIMWLTSENMNDILWSYVYPELLNEFRKRI